MEDSAGHYSLAATQSGRAADYYDGQAEKYLSIIENHYPALLRFDPNRAFIAGAGLA